MFLEGLTEGRHKAVTVCGAQRGATGRRRHRHDGLHCGCVRHGVLDSVQRWWQQVVLQKHRACVARQRGRGGGNTRRKRLPGRGRHSVVNRAVRRRCLCPTRLLSRTQPQRGGQRSAGGGAERRPQRTHIVTVARLLCGLACNAAGCVAEALQRARTARRRSSRRVARARRRARRGINARGGRRWRRRGCACSCRRQLCRPSSAGHEQPQQRGKQNEQRDEQRNLRRWQGGALPARGGVCRAASGEGKHSSVAPSQAAAQQHTWRRRHAAAAATSAPQPARSSRGARAVHAAHSLARHRWLAEPCIARRRQRRCTPLPARPELGHGRARLRQPAHRLALRAPPAGPPRPQRRPPAPTPQWPPRGPPLSRAQPAPARQHAPPQTRPAPAPAPAPTHQRAPPARRRQPRCSRLPAAGNASFRPCREEARASGRVVCWSDDGRLTRPRFVI